MNTIRKLFVGFIICLAFITLFAVAIGFDSETVKVDKVESVKAPVVTAELPPMVTETADSSVIELTNELTELSKLDIELTNELTESEPAFTPLDIDLDANVQVYLKTKCDEVCIDYAFVLALMKVESNFNPNAHSNTNDYGLMQINKCNHKSLSLATGATDFLDPYQNIDAGMYMLTDLFERYEEAELVLMAYHFGEGKAKKLWSEGKCTSKYSQTILNYQLEYQAMLEA